MGLLDKLRRPVDWERSVERKLGSLEGMVEGLHAQWATYRDEIKRLVNRLEKREQRARQRAEEEEQEPVVIAPEPPVSDDPISDRVRARRGGRRNGISLHAG